MAQSSTAKRVVDLITPYVESLGFKLWDVRFVKEGTSWYLRVFIDKENGITIDDCAQVSRLIDPVLDENDPIDSSYFLEVCSPGLERELVTPEHFECMMGRNIKIKLIRPKDGCREFCGRLVAYDGNITIDTNEAKIIFSKSEIVSVRLCDC